MGDREFAEYLQGLIDALPAREFDAAIYERAIGYPWARPAGSFRLTDAEAELLESLSETERQLTMDLFTGEASGRAPVVAIGSNAAPSVLERKFAHFPDEDDRAVLALTGRLHDFDIGVSPQPALYGAMPATLFPSQETRVCATVLWVTPTQFTQLAWSELNYRLGKLRTRFEVDHSELGFDEVLVFVSRFGAFCVEGRPVALAAVPATGRTAIPLSQEEMLGAAAAVALGPGATAEDLVRAIFEDPHRLAPKLTGTLHKETLFFTSERWSPYGADQQDERARQDSNL
jgi:hypothetical protein